MSTSSEVKGVYDLIINSYGPNKFIGSVHIEIDDKLTAKDIQYLERQIQNAAYDKFQIVLTIGVYASNNSTTKSLEIKEYLIELLKNYEHIIQMHGFYVDEEDETISFDIIIDFKVEDREEIYKKIYEEIQSKYKDYKIDIALDIDVSD